MLLHALIDLLILGIDISNNSNGFSRLSCGYAVGFGEIYYRYGFSQEGSNVIIWTKAMVYIAIGPPVNKFCYHTKIQGGQRFNAYGPARLAEGKIDQWYKDVHASKPGLWIAGTGCCSEGTISFHYVGPAETRAMHTLLHARDR